MELQNYLTEITPQYSGYQELHVHSDGSYRDAVNRVEDIFDMAEKLGRKAKINQSQKKKTLELSHVEKSFESKKIISLSPKRTLKKKTVGKHFIIFANRKKYPLWQKNPILPIPIGTKP